MAPLASVVWICTVLSTVVTVVELLKFCTAPCAHSAMAITKAIGSRMRTVVRVRSTQKLPMVRPWRRARPRMNAAASAMPTAADTKFCTARPDIWTRWPMVDSPEYDCQFVLVTKLTAVLKDIFGTTLGRPLSRGSQLWTRWNRYSASTETKLKASTASAYTFQRCSRFGFTRITR